jgi:spore coat polysaccharide biosynthesis protein SpsF
MLAHIIRRAQHIEGVDEVILATTPNRTDWPLVELAHDENIFVTTGDPEDVLRRLLIAAELVGAGTVIRICGDAPLFCPRFVTRCLRSVTTRGYDFLKRPPPCAYQGADVFSVPALELEWRKAAHRAIAYEHVSTWLYEHTELFNVGPWLPINASLLGEFHLSVDTPEDLDWMRGVYAKHYRRGSIVELEEVVANMG